MKYSKYTTTMLLVGLAIVTSGCKSQPADISYYVTPEIRNVSRVVFVEIGDVAGFPHVATRMTRSLAEAIVDRGLFRLDVLPAGHPALRDLKMHKHEPYTLRELAAIRKSLNCDAILFGRMVSYRQYPSMQIGLFLRLIDLKDGELVWAVDEVWDTTNRQTVKRIKNFYFDYMRESYEPAEWEMGIMSTSGFQKFVSFEILSSMDPEKHSASRPKFLFARPLRRVVRSQKKTAKNIVADY